MNSRSIRAISDDRVCYNNDEVIKMKVILQVRGMMCAHCENRVVQACKELEGLNEIHASAVENKVECDFDEAKLNVAQIKETIEAVGYDVVE